MKKEIRLVLTAIMFYTRIPVPRWVDHDGESLNKATKYFPLIGWIAGGIAALVFWTAIQVFDKPVAVLLSMVSTVLLTGAFHEDGFADVCDGFGGGWTKEKILLIMKDSRVGAFGAIGLFLLLALKFCLLLSVPNAYLPFSLIAAHALSRWVAATFIVTHQYVREGDDAKAKPVARHFATSHLLLGALFGLLPLPVLGTPLFLVLALPVYGMKLYLGRFFTKWIGGYTGDCLGATQQLCEIVFYLSALVLWKFT